MISLTCEQDSLKPLFYHCREFIENTDLIARDRILFGMLQGSGWTAENVSLMLRLHDNSNKPTQNLDGCLHLALWGSYFGKSLRVKALILLIEAGADVYAENQHGFTVSEYACMSRNQFNDAPNDSWRHWSSFSGLRKGWIKALTACGYDAEEVISRSVRVDKISEVDSDYNDESGDNDDIDTPSNNDESDDDEDEAGGAQLYQNSE